MRRAGRAGAGAEGDVRNALCGVANHGCGGELAMLLMRPVKEFTPLRDLVAAATSLLPSKSRPSHPDEGYQTAA